MLDDFIGSDSEKSDFCQYQEISNGKDSLYAYTIEEDPFMVELFEQNVRGYSYRLNDLKFEMLDEEFVLKIEEPQLIPAGRS